MDFFYITRDGERTVGLLKAGIFVVTNASPLAEALKDEYNNQLLVMSRQASLSTLELLKVQEVKDFVRAASVRPSIVVFKTSPQIERECKRLGWKLSNPSYEAGAMLEEKIGQWKWLLALRQAQDGILEFELPQVWVGELLTKSYNELVSELGEHPVVQFNRGHTGLGTFRIETEGQWKELREKFPQREVKVSRFYEGVAYTVNAVVIQETRNKKQVTIFTGNISKQLTGIPGCTNNPYATVGNDWSDGMILSETSKEKIYSCAEMVGSALGERGYHGLFGIDVIVTKVGANGRSPVPILIEVNPRQPASASLESQLQKERGEVSMMEWHIRAMQEQEDTRYQIQDTKKFYGFQLFFRNLENRPVQLKNEFKPGRYKVSHKGIEYIEKAASIVEAREREIFAFSVSKQSPVKPGGELLRIQSKNGMVETLGNEWHKAIQTIRDQVILA